MAFNIGFEKARLNELAADYPRHRRWIEKVAGRLVDLIVPFQSFAFYHPDQHGSCSLKSVLPALTGRGYEGMEIPEGTTAANEFMRAPTGMFRRCNEGGCGETWRPTASRIRWPCWRF